MGPLPAETPNCGHLPHTKTLGVICSCKTRNLIKLTWRICSFLFWVDNNSQWLQTISPHSSHSLSLSKSYNIKDHLYFSENLWCDKNLNMNPSNNFYPLTFAPSLQVCGWGYGGGRVLRGPGGSGSAREGLRGGRGWLLRWGRRGRCERGVLEGGSVSPPGQRDGVWTVGGTRSTRGRLCVTTWSEKRCLDSGRDEEY